MKSTLVTTLGVLSTFSLAGLAQSAPATDAEAVNCVELFRLDHTKVVDDETILFYLHGGDIYLNRLSHPAAGLRPNKPFMYKTSIGRLCNHDIITVLELWDFGYTEGGSSALGKFLPIDEVQANAVISGQPAAIEIEPIPAN